MVKKKKKSLPQTGIFLRYQQPITRCRGRSASAREWPISLAHSGSFSKPMNPIT